VGAWALNVQFFERGRLFKVSVKFDELMAGSGGLRNLTWVATHKRFESRLQDLGYLFCFALSNFLVLLQLEIGTAGSKRPLRIASSPEFILVVAR